MPFTHRHLLILPALLVLAATLEGLWLWRRESYDWGAYLGSLGDLGLRITGNLLPLGAASGLLGWLWNHRFHTMPLDSAASWAALFVGQEFCYYWMHRADHRVRWLWATHSVHHSPNALNLSAAYRLGWTGRLSIGPVFFAPLVLAGFPPLLVGATLAANLFYQFWLHATWLPRLGPLEWFLNTPAHHRVHHASNPEYLDHNFGGVLIVFDRVFGTFAAEQPGVRLRFGLTRPLRSNNPLLIGLHEWRAMLLDVWRARTLRQRLAALVGPPAGATP
ncbi:MAG: sterol desaturase family protein [Proteobacteria bacterium]|nr:sterol desaturase family protein [Pseudomonadota bacterium]